MYNIIVETNEATVVSEYIPLARRKRSYQSEAELEKNFIEDLQEQGYEYLTIKTEDDLVENLKSKLKNSIKLHSVKQNGRVFMAIILQMIQKEL